MTVDKKWIESQVESSEQIVPFNGSEIEDSINCFKALAVKHAKEYAIEQYGKEVELRFVGRDLHADDTAAFLRAIDSGLIIMENAGYFRPTACRKKVGGGRYRLFTANRWNNDNYLSLNFENLIHFGAATELHSVWAWEGDQIEVEVGEFDARVWKDGRVVVAMEAKARIGDSDGLLPLLQSFIKYAELDEPPEANNNHSNKYVELLKLVKSGPVLLWLVAAGARWSFKATLIENRILLEEVPNPSAASVRAMKSNGETKSMMMPTFAPSTDHAVAIATLTEADARQRAYEQPWPDKDSIYEFVEKLKLALEQSKITHAKPWVWTQATSTGSPLTMLGKDIGLELRFSFSP